MAEQAFRRSLSALMAWQTRLVAEALALPVSTKDANIETIVLIHQNACRREEATKAVEAVTRGIKRPGIVKDLLPSFDMCDQCGDVQVRTRHLA
jgi:hypothetical protein